MLSTFLSMAYSEWHIQKLHFQVVQCRDPVSQLMLSRLQSERFGDFLSAATFSVRAGSGRAKLCSISFDIKIFSFIVLMKQNIKNFKY